MKQHFLVTVTYMSRVMLAGRVVPFEIMPGSPRIEKAAKCRIDHPNLTVEVAMISAGFTEEEAKDERRRSNVRQKVHRLN